MVAVKEYGYFTQIDEAFYLVIWGNNLLQKNKNKRGRGEHDISAQLGENCMLLKNLSRESPLLKVTGR